jgi:hypothetical protein
VPRSPTGAAVGRAYLLIELRLRATSDSKTTSADAQPERTIANGEPMLKFRYLANGAELLDLPLPESYHSVKISEND